jgi:hypothetical protein
MAATNILFTIGCFGGFYAGIVLPQISCVYVWL